MKTPKQKHMTFEDRCVIQEFLDYNHSFTEIGNRIGKDRRSISKEVWKHRYLKKGSAKNNQKECRRWIKPPYVCNGCEHKTTCRRDQYRYDAAVAHNEYKKILIESRANVRITKEEIGAINDVVAPLMIHKHHSVNHVYVSHPECLNFSKSTFYRYIDMGLLNVRNIDLQRKVRYKPKKEYNYKREKVNTKIKVGRFYTDFQDYIALHPNASVVEMDTVIGTSGGKGGKCMLTLLFRQSNFMLIYLLPYKRAEYVNEIFYQLKKTLGDEEFARLFEVILTDNGTEFSDPLSIETSIETGEKLSHVFYCDPNCSWQKGSLERNHQYIRYILPKGTSFAGLVQDDCYLLASHINSVPRQSLNNNSPYDIALPLIGKENMDKLKIVKIPYDEINLSMSLLKKK